MELFLIESPGKIRKIQSILPSNFLVKATLGHIRDLKAKQLSVDTRNGFTTDFIELPQKRKLIAELRGYAAQAKHVWLAMDNDLEGEAIAQHLAETLRVEDDKIKRVRFNEITREAIMGAIDNPTKVDANIVAAQLTRRVVDRLLGYKVSPVLWKYLDNGLSAGRVQSIALKIIADRDIERRTHKPELYFDLTAEFNGSGQIMAGMFSKKLPNERVAKDYLEGLAEGTFTIDTTATKEETHNPPAPFTTSSLQQEASIKLGLSPKVTMAAAQKLYEAGYITYMRTDSPFLSKAAQDAAKNEVTQLFGEDMHQERQYSAKASAQEAHECIRPTRFHGRNPPGISEMEHDLYKLIWSRSVASQMVSSVYDVFTLTIPYRDGVFNIVWKNLSRPGFMLASCGVPKIQVDIGKLKKNLKSGQTVTFVKGSAEEHHTLPPPLYSESALVKRLEELGIGRPSTYAGIVTTIQEKEYVAPSRATGVQQQKVVLTLQSGDKHSQKSLVKSKTGDERGKLVPTETGRKVSKFLKDNFATVINEQFTAQMEAQMDLVATGEKDYKSTVQRFYGLLEPIVYRMMNQGGQHRIFVRPGVGNKRYLGKHPESGLGIHVFRSKYNPIIMLGTGPNAVFAGFKEREVKVADITLEKAVEILGRKEYLRTEGYRRKNRM